MAENFTKLMIDTKPLIEEDLKTIGINTKIHTHMHTQIHTHTQAYLIQMAENEKQREISKKP